MSNLSPSSSAHVDCFWYVLNALDVGSIEKLAHNILSQDELERAERFKATSAKQLFTAGRILLRWLLSLQLEIPAKSLSIQTSAKGKPFVAGLDKPIYFNISHSGQTLLLALTHHGEIGVDVEVGRERTNIQGLAERILCAAELQHFNVMTKEQQRSAFFRYWVLKESFVKMKGDGISYGLDKIHFDERNGFLLAPQDKSASVFLQAPEGHFAALCLDQAAPELIELRSTQVHSLSEYLNALGAS